MIDAATSVKAKSLAVYFGISVPFLSFINVDVDLLMIMIIIMLVDTVLGAIIAIWLSEYKSRTFSDRFRIKVVLCLLVCAVAFTSTYYHQLEVLVNSMMSMLILNEMISIMRHGYTIIYKEKIPESDVLKPAIRFVISTLEKRMLAVQQDPSDKKQ